MKKYLLLLSVLASTALAQQDEKTAFTVLDSLCQHRNFQAVFTYHSRSRQESTEETREGTITVQGSQYRLSLTDQEIITNGETVWTYLKAANEVQIDDYDPEQAATTPWGILNNYRQDYVFFGLRTQQIGDEVLDIVELLSKDKEHSLPKITLTIERTSKHLRCLEALDSNQTIHTFLITKFATDLALAHTFFTFNPEEHQDVEVIDMR